MSESLCHATVTLTEIVYAQTCKTITDNPAKAPGELISKVFVREIVATALPLAQDSFSVSSGEKSDSFAAEVREMMVQTIVHGVVSRMMLDMLSTFTEDDAVRIEESMDPQAMVN